MTKKQTSPLRSCARNCVKLAAVPRQANDYRPYAIRKWNLLVITLLLLAVQVAYLAINNRPNVLGAQIEITITGLLESSNEAREANDKKPLTLNGKLMRAAQKKLKTCSTNNTGSMYLQRCASLALA